MRALMVAAILFSAAVAHGQPAKPDAQILAEGDAAFDRGVQERRLLLQSRRDFALAADRYRELHRRGIQSAALYRSLGNAATLADRLPEAIWAYHLGLQLDPNDADLREHLAFLRSKVNYPPTGQGRVDADAWPPWLYRPTLYEYICIVLFSYIILCCAGKVAFRRRSRFWLAIALAFFLIAASAGIGVWQQATAAQIDRDTPLVVVAENTPLYRGNATSYPSHPSLALLYRGMEVWQLHRRGAWLQVRLSTGEIGWLPATSALIVEP